MILLPVKNLENAKERLSPVLERAERRALAEAMLQDVMHALGDWRGRPDVTVVTSDPFATELARQFSFEIIEDRVNRSETDAIQMATESCVARGAEWTLVIPGDIPLVQSSELEQILAAAPSEGSVLVPGWDGRGSNAVWRRPAELFPLRFGNDSFGPHLHAAQATGKECVVLRLPGIGLDVDNPADLSQLMAAGGDTRAQRLLRGWKIADRLLAVGD
ncbi:MAG TPA: 2-phospho-L-lactate guanylyltransferase [Terriglobales bacterium]|nr:2-phospho-L-lactate guanylyltransferase [Terriglobales bacterium]